MNSKQIKNLNLKVIILIIVLIASSRIIPHPPNFTPIISLGLYIPIIFGMWSIPFFILCYAITDFVIGFHELLIWTWGSLAIIGLVSKFGKSLFSRLVMSFCAAMIFFIISNFGVWLTGSFYANNIEGLINCYTMAIPFFTNTLLSTIMFAILIEFFVFSKYFNFIPLIKKKNY